MACDVVVAAECLQLLHHRFPPCLGVIAVGFYREGRVDAGCAVHFLCIGKICQESACALASAAASTLLASAALSFAASLPSTAGEVPLFLMLASLGGRQFCSLHKTIFQVSINDIRWLGELNLLHEGSAAFKIAQLHLEERVEGGNLFSFCL